MPKKKYFPNGIIHGFLFKNRTSFHLGFWNNHVGKDSFLIFWIEKNDF